MRIDKRFKDLLEQFHRILLSTPPTFRRLEVSTLADLLSHQLRELLLHSIATYDCMGILPWVRPQRSQSSTF